MIDPSGQHAYITNIYGDDVAVLDLETLEVVATIPVGDKPNGISFSPVTLEPRPDTSIQLPVTGQDEQTSGSDADGHSDGVH